MLVLKRTLASPATCLPIVYVHLINYFDPKWVDMVAEVWIQMMEDAEIPVAKIEQRIRMFRQSWEVVPMFTVEILKGGISQFVLGLIVSLPYVFRNPRKQLAKE
jgi:hypothetical protein